MYSREIKEVIEKASTEAVFTPKDFLNITSYNNAKLVLSRLEKTGMIKRLIDGFYYKPVFSKLINDYAPISPYAFVNKVAQINDWNICVYGEAALNYFSLSTQVPAKYIFISDGPYRTYNIDCVVIYFKHTNKNIKKVPFRVAAALEALKYLGKDKVDKKVIERLKSQLTENELLELEKHSIKSSIWIYNIIKNENK